MMSFSGGAGIPSLCQKDVSPVRRPHEQGEVL